MKEINKILGKLICAITKKHREPHQIASNHVWKIEFCNRCGRVFSKEKIGRTFREIFDDVNSNSGNQIW